MSVPFIVPLHLLSGSLNVLLLSAVSLRPTAVLTPSVFYLPSMSASGPRETPSRPQSSRLLRAEAKRRNIANEARGSAVWSGSDRQMRHCVMHVHMLNELACAGPLLRWPPQEPYDVQADQTPRASSATAKRQHQEK